MSPLFVPYLTVCSPNNVLTSKCIYPDDFEGKSTQFTCLCSLSLLLLVHLKIEGTLDEHMTFLSAPDLDLAAVNSEDNVQRDFSEKT